MPSQNRLEGLLVSPRAYWGLQVGIAIAASLIAVILDGLGVRVSGLTFACEVVVIGLIELVIAVLRLRDAKMSLWLLAIPTVLIAVPTPLGWLASYLTMSEDAELGALIWPGIGLLVSVVGCLIFWVWLGSIKSRRVVA